MNIIELNERSKKIFRQIVESYLETGDPIGSRTLAKAGALDVSPATIRNVMADLEEAGLVMAPHTSAGRIPTDTGLRMFVDGLMEVGNLSKLEQESILGQCKATGRNMEEVLSDATKALAGLSNCASVVMVPKDDFIIRQVEFVALAPDRALVVLVSDDGTVENRIISLPPNLPASTLVMAGNFMNARLSGRTLAEAEAVLAAELTTHQAELDILTAKVVADGLAVWSDNTNNGTKGGSLIVSGQGNLLDSLQAADDFERIRRLFDDLESKKEMINLLQAAKEGGGVRIFIGAENNLFSLSGSSLVVSPYMNTENNIVGVIGVIGPTRLNYARIIPMVDYTAQVVSRLL